MLDVADTPQRNPANQDGHSKEHRMQGNTPIVNAEPDGAWSTTANTPTHKNTRRCGRSLVDRLAFLFHAFCICYPMR